MIFDAKELTNAVSNISTLISGEDSKSIPGVLLDIGEGVRIRFSNNRKTFDRPLKNFVREDIDIDGRFALEYEPLVRAIANCQPIGRIQVNEIKLTQLEKTFEVSAEQKLVIGEDELGNEVTKLASVKKMTIPYRLAGNDMKSAVLVRANYEGIFDTDGADLWDIDEFKRIVDKLAPEKQRAVYLVSNWRIGFVCNQAHVTVVPVEHDFQNNVIVMESSIKPVVNILTKVRSEVGVNQVYVKNIDDKFLAFFTEDMSCGIMIEAVKASRILVQNLQNYQDLTYDTYQLSFYNDVLKDNIRTAMTSSTGDDVTLKFEQSEDGELELLIKVGGSSMTNEPRIGVVGAVLADDITTQEFPISLKVMSDILSQLDTELVAFDVSVREDGTRNLRLAEISTDTLVEETENLCREKGLTDGTQLSDDDKRSIRDKIIVTEQFTTMKRQ